MSTPMSSAEAAGIHNLTDLIASGSGTARKIFPTDDQIASLLHSRSRGEHPYVRVSPSGRDYVVLNPLRTLGCLNEESRGRYTAQIEGSGDELQPSVYELAGRVWSLMSRRKESQAVIYHGLSGSGKSTTSHHLTTQILSLASPAKTQKRLSDQITYLHTLLTSFGHSKTPLNPSASQHGLYTELHFTSHGRITGAKALPFGLNKSRVGGRLQHEERSFHIFYQLLAGASPEERDSLGLEDPSAYAMLSQSGCYLLPGGPFSDDSTQLSELRVALASLGFKGKHVRSIFTVLTAILTLSNLEFTDDRGHGSLGMTSLDERARVLDRHTLATAAAHLGVPPDDLEAVLVNRTRWVRKDLCSMFLDTRGAEQQRDTLMRDLYAILFTFVVEMANKKLASDETPELQIVQLELPGHTSRTSTDAGTASRPGSMFQPLINATGENGFDEFSTNFVNEVLHSYLVQRAFEDGAGENLGMAEDGMRLPGVVTMDNSSALELLRGGTLGQKRLAVEVGGMMGMLGQISEEFKGDDEEHHVADEKVLSRLTRTFGRHPSYIVSPGLGTGPLPDRHTFAINHYSGACSYDVADFAERNLDVLDKQLVDLLRGSTDAFVSKLVSGPGLAVEGHPLDPNITVEAQVSATPLRLPSQVINPLIGSAARGEVQWPIDVTVPQAVSAQLNGVISTLAQHLDQFRLWTVYCLRPSDTGHANAFDRRRVKAQVRSLLLPDLVNRRQVDWVADYGLAEFCGRHELRMDAGEEDAIDGYAERKGWFRGREYDVGRERVWLGWKAWKEQEDEVRAGETRRGSAETLADEDEEDVKERAMGGEGDHLLGRRETRGTDYSPASATVALPYGHGPGLGHGLGGYQDNPDFANSAVWSDVGGQGKFEPDSRSPYEKVRSEENLNYHVPSKGLGDKNLSPVEFNVKDKKKHVATEIIATTRSRRWWIRITWAFTFWIPSFLLSSLGRMKRPDVRMAWREKLTIFMMVLLSCGIVLFYIIGFGKLLCPDGDKAWNPTDLSGHAGTTDYYAAIAGKVYDFTNFYKGQHSDITAYPTSSTIMLQFAGQDLTSYFPPPMTVACPGLVTNDQLELRRANFTPILDYAIHRSGPVQLEKNTRLNDINWWKDRLRPDLEQYYKGAYVFSKGYIAGEAESSGKQWGIYKNKVYDLSDYLYTVQYYSTSSGTNLPNYKFLDTSLSGLFSTNSGQDITKQMDAVFAGMSDEVASRTWACLDNAFFVGQTDFRDDARCKVQNYLLLALSIILCTVILVKFLAALQLGSKRHPEIFDKFVICQVPCYTEGEESLKRTIDSLSILNYDDKRKLIFIICDGNIIGSGNNRPTPRIVLDILGVDPSLDPEPLLFKSIGEGSKQLNYGKIYSGLYEHEGHVVPYIVVVKVGKPTETSKPGNRGKRDSQVLLLQYLNRVHFEAPMSPLELEIYHQMRNVIGIDPAFYEYIFQVDADTTVEPDSLNRLIACTSDDSQIIGICGETKLENERESLTTMIQVYEYFISHHLTKAFESLFGSVTCLPGCFSVYRIRTADKGRPIIISSVVIDEYAEPNVDTLHKKNLFSLGEDRYLTTLMMKHFPTYKMKFTPDAIAHTVAPSRWNVLLSQRRRWINSTVHNLVELIALPELCGFCFFSLRFVVFIDLLGTIILPATCVYLVYLVVIVSTGAAALPMISLIMIAAVYGLQMIIFILRREFMLIGWMVLYILAFPIYSVYLPLYSFWSMDDFSWGNTRQVVGEGNNKTVVYEDDEVFTDDMIPYKSFKDYEANAWETQSLHSEKSRHTERSQAASFRPPRFIHSRNPSAHSSTASLPQGGDYWRDSSPLGPAHSSRNLRTMPSQSSLLSGPGRALGAPNAQFMGGQRVQSMAGLSMWGGGSVYDAGGPQQPGFMHPQMTGMSGGSPMMGHPQMAMNPFDSPMMMPMSDGGRQSGYYPQVPVPGMMGMGAPRGSVMTNLGGYGLGSGGGGGGMPRGVSTYSLATTNHPLAPLPQVNPASAPEDGEVVDVLRRYLATQDLMSVTKRQTREALYGLFPNANLQSRAAWVNENIDKILSE